MTEYRDKLREIKTFSSLVKFLRDDLDWPIAGTDDFEDLTFDYTPEELGIDAESAAKIEEIKRLRPLVANQPWGVFFVKFEPKQLPVVALRRILNGVVVKKRATPSAAEQHKWPTEDLLFISNYGEGSERKISFAHFSHDPTRSELPTLKVLAWDDLDTPLHLEHAANTLVEKLAWPASAEEWDDETWRERWSSAFVLRHREVITTSKALAERLALLARTIRDRVKAVLDVETKDGPVTKMMEAFREALIHDLEPDDFADMYAQTVAYGLLSARVTDPRSGRLDRAELHLPVTNPFLKELMDSFLSPVRRGDGGGSLIDFDELGVNDVVDLLDDPDTNMEAVVRDFGDQNPDEDPVIHFYEHFLKEYDAKMRMQRGVFYTPRPVVSYIVRSIDALLRTEFGLKDGLADAATWGEMVRRNEDLKIPPGVLPEQAFVQILDPATGTGTFLVEAIDLIHATLIAKWQAQGHDEAEIGALWNDYVPKHLLPRLHGYELLMAPYAIAHLKIGLKLYETGYGFHSDERARVYLTNALEQAADTDQQVLEGALPALAHEAKAVNAIKRHQRFTVVIGNPPYSLMSANLGPEQRRLIDAYRYVDGAKIKERGALQLEKNLQDDYVKFLRFAETVCMSSPWSAMGFITNHAYLENPTLRGLRRSFIGTFSSLWLLDLHGNLKRKERSPLPGPDVNVFDIQQGVAVVLGARKNAEADANLSWGELWGSREKKYSILGAGDFRQLSNARVYAMPELYLFTPQDEELRAEFDSGLPLDRIFAVYSTGIATARDRLTVHFSRADLQATIREFSTLEPEQARERFGLGRDTNDWKVGLAIADLQHTGCRTENERSYQYRPFDRRYTYYTGQPRGFLCNPRWPVMSHLLAGDNLALCGVKAVETGDEFAHVFVTNVLADHHCVSLKEVNYVFPLLVYPESAELGAQRGLFNETGGVAVPNLTPDFLALVSERLGVDLASDSDGSGKAVDARELLSYIYGVLHSGTFRDRYAMFLRKEFARIPIPRSRGIFEALAALGTELMALHLMESARLDHFIATYEGPRNPEVARVGWSDQTVWLDALAAKKDQPATPGTIGFRGVPEDVWNFHVGGYQVCEKWLKDRKGRVLSDEDIAHYQRVVVALSETIRLMLEIDGVIEEHGGWPGAFTTSVKDAVA